MTPKATATQKICLAIIAASKRAPAIIKDLTKKKP